MTKSIILILIGMSVSGCNYITNRGRDLKDIVGIEVGMGIGAKAQAGPINVGFDGFIPAYGVGSGELATNGGACAPNNFEFQALIFGFQEQYRYGMFSERNKNYSNKNIIIPIRGESDNENDLYKGSNPAYWTQIELTAGFIGAGKFKFNPGEIIDFILGLACIDLYGDDLNNETSKSAQQVDSSEPATPAR